MNILIGKLSRNIYFNKEKWSIYAGDEEATLLYTMLARRYPEHKFYMVGRSDLTKYRKKTSGASLFADEEEGIPENIIDLWEDCPPELFKANMDQVNPSGNLHFWMGEKIQRLGLKFDAGIIYQGPSGPVGTPNTGIKTLDGVSDAKTLIMFNVYHAPIVYTLNITQVPFVLLCSDPRYVPLLQRDMFNDELTILSQINKKIPDRKRIVSYDQPGKIRYVTLNYEYSAIETVFMLDEKKTDFRTVKKDNLFIMGLNGGGNRQQIIKEWLLDRKGDCDIKIYGKWEDDFTAQYPGVFENKGIKEVEDVFWATKYTMIPPFHNSLSNFVTQKFWKMIVYGIIPFFHPKYDTDKIFKVPDFLRVKSPDEMWKKIRYLESNKDDYDKVMNKLWNMLDDGYYDGTILTNNINAAFKEKAGFTL